MKKNGNRAAKTTPFGTIEYTYDKENCLLSSGSKGQSLVTYSYDHMGNLLTETSSSKTTKYAYNSQNRLIYCEVTDNTEMTYNQTTYAYDAFGRRVLVQDANEATLHTIYDGLTFEVLKQAPIFENGLFTDANNLGVKYTRTGRPTGDRYRYLSDNDKNDGNRYFYLDEGSYKTTDTRYRGERTQIIVNGTMAAQSSSDYGAEYFTTDLLGSVSTVTNTHGNLNTTYTYDVFGSLVQGELTGTTDFGYLGKQQDQTAKLYNYGYRDYKPQTARFTTIDPIRDGENWFVYCNCDPINFIDLLGLELILTLDKDNLTLDIVYKENGRIQDVMHIKGDNSDLEKSPITTAVKSHDNSTDIDKGRETDYGSNPKRMPDGEWNITGIEKNPKSDPAFGDFWLITDAYQDEPYPDGSFKKGNGYDIHLTPFTNTNGCLGIHDEQLMNKLIELYCKNEERDPGTSKLKVYSNKNK